LTIKYKLPTSLAGGKLSYTDSLNKNIQQIAIAKALTNSFRYTMFFGKLPKTPATIVSGLQCKLMRYILEAEEARNSFSKSFYQFVTGLLL